MVGLWRKAVLVTVAGCSFPAAGGGQQTIVTDRPGLGFATSTVPSGAAQAEVGVPSITLRRESGVQFRTIAFPLLMRVGVRDGLELRVGGVAFNYSRERAAATTQTSHGGGPLEVGAKFAILQGSSGPALVLIPSVILPVGDSEFAGKRSSYTLNAVAGWPLPGGFGLTTVAGASLVPAGDDDRDVAGTLAAVLGHSLTPRLSTYLESGWQPTPDTSDPVLLGGGATLLVRDRVQLDVFFDRRIRGVTADWQFGAGFSVRS